MECKFCKHPLTEPLKFCPKCGENLSLKRLDVKTILSTFFSEFLNYDNKLYRTFIHLFKQPETVINSYIKGSRKTYVNVITYFSISLTLTAFQLFFINNISPDLLDNEYMNPINGEELPNYAFDIKLYDYQGIMAILIAPFSAIMSYLAFIDKKKYNLAEHIIINVYPSAQFFILWFFLTIVIITLNINFLMASGLSMIPLYFYMVYIFKRLYDINYLQSILRTTLYFILFAIFYAVVMFILGIAIILYLNRTGQINL